MIVYMSEYEEFSLYIALTLLTTWSFTLKYPIADVYYSYSTDDATMEENNELQSVNIYTCMSHIQGHLASPDQLFPRLH